ncbi:NAD(P)(+) transhydrogenase (Re/Si-specific) subunit alpha, partial [bacterium]|nr:NAD(P)(+) transhydrogenase (Re/Si-specific) subunit alpha [bacterium]
VHSYDVRPAVKEQVESLGAQFVELELDTKQAEGSGGYAKAMDEEFYRKQRQMMLKVLEESDVAISTAAVPGKKAPILITAEMVKGMREGSVIVDLAAETGGNCELTKPGETIEAHGVKILGPVNLPSSIPYHASQMYSRNISAFLQLIVKNGELNLDLEDQIVREALVVHNKEIVNPRVRELLGLAPANQTTVEQK